MLREASYEKSSSQMGEELFQPFCFYARFPVSLLDRNVTDDASIWNKEMLVCPG